MEFLGVSDHQRHQLEVEETNRLFVRRKQLPGDRPERPRTALATMRIDRNRDPEFQGNQHNHYQGPSGRAGKPSIQVISKDSVRNLIIPQDQPKSNPPLVLTRRDFEKILNAAKVIIII